ncbi:MAG: SET domain-containing protein-lysine N-methyltransferase [Ferruginibacter sp.]
MITSNTSLALEIISRHDVADVYVDPITAHRSLHAAVAFNAEEVIARFGAKTMENFATYLTVQTGIDRHITLKPEFLQFVNHSCDPNVFFDTGSMEFVALKDIQPGEQLCFFYPSTEWEMAQPFLCSCGTSNCLQLINGAAHLSTETLSKYRLTNFILQQLKQKNIAV